MFERFTADARAIVRGAQEEARRLRHRQIGTEHLLLAMAEASAGPGAETLHDRGLDAADLRRRVVGAIGAGGPDDGEIDPQALATLGIDLEQVRRVTEASFGPGALDARSPAPSGHIPFGKRAKKVLELSLREALRLGHDHIGSGHVLLGLIREGEGLAAKVLVDAGADLTVLRDDVVRRISSEAA
jgi:ATP-dependent Clp protease ATP-binding subunit ClpA